MYVFLCFYVMFLFLSAVGYDNITSGASSDIMQATRLAKAMVTKYGLSDKVGVYVIVIEILESYTLISASTHPIIHSSYHPIIHS